MQEINNLNWRQFNHHKLYIYIERERRRERERKRERERGKRKGSSLTKLVNCS